MPEGPAKKIVLPPEVLRYIAKEAPKDARLMAAKALLPMAPAIQVTVLFFLTGDAEEEVRSAARESLLGMPKGMLKKTLAEPLHPKVLDFFAKEKRGEDDLLEMVLLNSATADETFAELAEGVGEKGVQLIAANEARLLRFPKIAEQLRKNPQAPRNLIDRAVSFLRMNGIALEGESAELTPEEINALMQQASAPGLEGMPEEEEEDDFPEELLLDTEQPMDEEQRQGLAAKISEMSVAQKIKLALMGNKEVRSLLIKDTNKVVSTAVIKSPRITEMEVANICQMRSINDEILRIICRTPEWTRDYNIQLALCNNPKTPLQSTMRYVRGLRLRDLQNLAKSKGVPGPLTKLAKELYEQKR